MRQQYHVILMSLLKAKANKKIVYNKNAQKIVIQVVTVHNIRFFGLAVKKVEVGKILELKEVCENYF